MSSDSYETVQKRKGLYKIGDYQLGIINTEFDRRHLS